MEQFVLIPLSVYEEKFRLQKPILEPTPVPKEIVPKNHSNLLKSVNRTLKTNNNKALVEEILNSPRIKISNSDTIILDGKETNVSFSDFVFRLKRKNEQFPDLYFAILDAIGLDSDLVINSNAKSQDRGGWIPFEI